MGQQAERVATKCGCQALSKGPVTQHPQEAGDIQGICVNVYRMEVYEWAQGVMCIGV